MRKAILSEEDFSLENALGIVVKKTGQSKLQVLAGFELRHLESVIALAEENAEHAALKSAQESADARKAHDSGSQLRETSDCWRSTVFRVANPRPTLKGLTYFR
jgi:hypothetical protein